MTTVHFAILAALTWRVVRWKVSPRRAAVRRGHDRTPWLVALASDAVLFAGLAYREHRRKVRAGKPTAVRDRRRSTWTTSTTLGGLDGLSRPSSRRRAKPRPDDEIPF